MFDTAWASTMATGPTASSAVMADPHRIRDLGVFMWPPDP
jgi:hypothetical protein